MGRRKDITNQRFGKFTAIEATEKRGSDRSVIWKVLCDCGRFTESTSAQLKGGETACKCGYKYRRSYDGDQNPNWENFRTIKPESAGCRAHIRKKLGICEKCEQAPAVERHHIDHNPFNNDPKNLLGLCRKCHFDSHFSTWTSGQTPIRRSSK